jgi:nucleoside-diphosphate-sugar epimerase
MSNSSPPQKARQTALVTGATGFIGSHLVSRLLKEGHHVRVLCRKESQGKLLPEFAQPKHAQMFQIAYGDLKDRNSLEIATQGVTHIYHCAGQVLDWGSDQEFNAINIQGTAWLLESAARAQVKRFVHLSTVAVFGVPAPSQFSDESPYGSSQDPYSRTKMEGEKIALQAYREKSVPVTVLRPTVVYGPRSTWLEEPLRMIQKGKMFLLDRGKGTCHPCYIENLMDAMMLVSEHPAAVGQAYLVGDDDPIPFSRYFQGVASLAGQGPIKRSIPLTVARAMATTFEAAARLTRSSSRPLLTHTAIDMVCTPSQMSMDKIRRELGFRPRYRFDQAIQELRSVYQPSNLNRNRDHVPSMNL